MQQLLCRAGLFVAMLLAALPLLAKDAAAPLPTVESHYQGLSSGPLRQAKLAALPKGVLLRAGKLTITEKQVAEEIARAKPDVQAQLKRYQFFLLEQVSIKGLLLVEARAWAAAEKRDAKESDDAVIRAYLQSVAATAAVSEEEMKAFYAANAEMLGGMPYEAVEKDLRQYLLDEKRQEVVEVHINSLSGRMPIDVDAGWVKAGAATALDNPVDAARRAGKPAMIDFGAAGCGPCDMMEPILKDLQQTHTNRCTILYVDVREAQILAARYGIQSIPVQIFFDRDGKEVFRHTGFLPREKILAQLAALGVE